MVDWYADGEVSTDWSNGRLYESVFLASPGNVDLNYPTRIQYNKPMAGPGDPSSATQTFDRVRASARFEFTSGEANALTGTQRLTASMFVTPATEFAAGSVPTPAQVRDNAVAVFRSTNSTTSGGKVPFGILGPRAATLNAGAKYWILVIPTRVTWGSTPSIANDQVVGFVSAGRGLSIWTNRSPVKPTVTEPQASVVQAPGTIFNLTFDSSNDPDFNPGFQNSDSWNINGVQVQIAPAPTSGASPVWRNGTFATTYYFNGPNPPDADDTVTTPSWYISGSNYPSPSDIAGPLFYQEASLKVIAGMSETNPVVPRELAEDYQTSISPVAGALILPSGDWLIRMRTFDPGGQGGYYPINYVDGDYTPDTYPAYNKSPWSDSVRVVVPEQVPPPIPISPINAVAIPEDKPVTLTWQYRNTYIPPKAQKSRQIEIRKVGENLWTTLVSGNSALTTYPVNTAIEPAEYMTDGSFEAGTLGGWTTPLASNTVVNDTGPAHSGTRSLKTNQGPATAEPAILTFERRFAITPGHSVFTLTGFVRRNGAALGTTGHTVLMQWRNASDQAIGTTSATVGMTADANGYRPVTATDVVAPAGATVVIVIIIPTINSTPTEGSSSGDRIDDFSLMGMAGEGYTLEAGNEYEWRVRVTDTSDTQSSYSKIARFWVVPTPNSGEVMPVPASTIDGATLGCGAYKVFVYKRGGRKRVAEITHISKLDWSRVRDDISTAGVVISGWDIDCGNLLARLQPWAYELVLFRNNGYGEERVWEGPITLITYQVDKVVIDAKDVMAYAYRRIIKQAMNDTGTSPSAGRTVTSRAVQVLQNAFAPDDPNVLGYLTPVANSDDAKQYRALPAWSRTAFEEVDDMAANAGLDYTAVGRRIIVWGTKHRIGTLPEFRDADLGSPPIVSQYGMSMANVYAVSDGNGLYGVAVRGGLTVEDGVVSGNDPDFGLVEMLSSTWASDSGAETGTYTQAGQETVKASFVKSSERSIEDRYPPPVVVRVPDNTTLNPSTVLSIQQLVPGVVIPLRSTGTLRKVLANQKLDSIKVTVEDNNESISVTMSPFNRDDNQMEEGA